MKEKVETVISSFEPEMIKVVKLTYWDGSKYMARLDRPNSLQALTRVRSVMKARFASLSPMKQRALVRNWSQGNGKMVVRKVVRMSEDEYNKSDKVKD